MLPSVGGIPFIMAPGIANIIWAKINTTTKDCTSKNYVANFLNQVNKEESVSHCENSSYHEMDQPINYNWHTQHHREHIWQIHLRHSHHRGAPHLY